MERREQTQTSGITMVELLIVLALVAVIAAVAFAALDPLRRFRESRDATRWSDISAILGAIVVYRTDHGGQNLPAIGGTVTGTVSLIGTAVSDCHSQNAFCDTDVGGSTACVDLTGLVSQGYIPEVPVSPNGNGEWTSEETGYTLTKTATGAIVIRACESESSDEITITR